MFTELKLVIWKNLLIRKRHWILTIVEALMPVLLFGLIAYGRSQITGLSKQIINQTRTSDPITADDIYNELSVGDSELWYSPFNSYTEELMRKVQLNFHIPGQDVREFGSEQKLLKYFETHHNRSVYAVIFKGNDPKKLDYDLRIHKEDAYWFTTKLFPSIFSEPPGAGEYLRKGFLAIQLALDTAFIEYSAKVDKLKNVSFLMQEFPYPPHTEDYSFSNIFMTYLPTVTIFSFIFMCPAVLKRVVEEKVSGIKELMKMVGMQSWMTYLGWFLHAFIVNIPSVVCIVVFMKVPLFGTDYPPIEYCDGTVFFVFLLLYCAAGVSFCFLVGSVVNRPAIAMVTGILLWIFTYFLPRSMVGADRNVSWMFKSIFGVFPNMALHYGYGAISVYETTEVGVQWTNLFKSGSEGQDDITMGNVFVMFILQILFYNILTAYIDSVNPGVYGIAKPLHFPLLYLKRILNCVYSKPHTQVEDDSSSLTSIEEGRGETAYIEIIQLRKRFGAHWAVDGLNMNIYENRITVLLGHNGAGKTTTMSILTGMIPATGGQIKINGVDIQDEISNARRKMGLCPQHNLLFPDLTVVEHLKFFAMLKGSTFAEASQQARKMLATFNLVEKENSLASSLSGGMKRKLCLGMSLIGNSPILILDEPTAGMDPESRRKVWDLLLELRKTRTILVTTHFMEEADVLGDWIAIMVDGKLRCHGTPMYLKKKYGTGYRLHISLRNPNTTEEVTAAIQSVLPDASLLQRDDKNVAYTLPMDQKISYSTILRKINSKKETLGIDDMAVTVTTLNDVFLKTRPQDETSEMSKRQALEQPTLTNEYAKVRQTFFVLLLKRWIFLTKKCLIYLPAFVILLAMLILTINLSGNSVDSDEETFSKLDMNLRVYGKTGVYVGSPNIADKNPIVADLLNKYAAVAENQEGSVFLEKDVSQAISDKGIENIAYYKQHMIAAANFALSSRKQHIAATALYNTIPWHAAPVSLNLLTNAVAQHVLGSTEYSISTSNHPLPTHDSGPAYLSAEVSKSEVTIYWFIFVPIGLLFFVGNLIAFPNYEISTKFYQLQYFCGVSSFTLWMSNVVFDIAACAVQLLAVIVATFAVNSLIGKAHFDLNEYATLLLIMSVYCISAMPFVYLFSFRKTIAKGFALLLISGLFLGLVPTVVVAALEMCGDPHYVRIGHALKHVFLVFCPPFSVSYVCVNFALKYADNYNWFIMSAEKRKVVCDVRPNPCCEGDTAQCTKYKSYFHNEDYGISAPLLEMLSSFLIYFVVLLLIESRWVKWLKNKIAFLIYKTLFNRGKNKGDYNLVTDEAHQNNCGRCEHKLHAKRLSKWFGRKKVVKDVSLNVAEGKCYGLLGVNGAGKTTTFRMLTSDIVCDGGRIGIKKNRDQVNDILINDSNYLPNIGYCPQNDALNYALTGREMLTIMARLKGYRQDDATNVANYYLELFDLKQYADKPCLEYSGGNKRKLNACLAFVGFSDVILLDEPTNGMDPASRHSFWTVLSAVKKKKNTAFVLCSHSMDECEALCDTISIMKEGTIKCSDTLMRLKQQYQKGFMVTFKLNPQGKNEEGAGTGPRMLKNSVVTMDTDVVDGPVNTSAIGWVDRRNGVPEADAIGLLKRDFERQFESGKVEIKDEHSTLLHYWVEADSKNLADIFEKVEELQKRHPQVIEDYSISQASLEDIFLSVANS